MPYGDVTRRQRGELHYLRQEFKRHEQIVAVAVAAKLLDQGHTFDDPITERRWVFNRLGQLIASHSKAQCLVTAIQNRPWGAFTPARPVVHLNI